MKCKNCGKQIVMHLAEDEYDEEGWVHKITGRPSCDLYAAPKPPLYKLSSEAYSD